MDEELFRRQIRHYLAEKLSAAAQSSVRETLSSTRRQNEIQCNHRESPILIKMLDGYSLTSTINYIGLPAPQLLRHIFLDAKCMDCDEYMNMLETILLLRTHTDPFNNFFLVSKSIYENIAKYRVPVLREDKFRLCNMLVNRKKIVRLGDKKGRISYIKNRIHNPGSDFINLFEIRIFVEKNFLFTNNEIYNPVQGYWDDLETSCSLMQEIVEEELDELTEKLVKVYKSRYNT